MEANFWLNKWQEIQSDKAKASFHNPQVQGQLEKLYPKLNFTASDTVFVPLCGKSYDLFWLSEQGHKVIGIELSSFAVESFFNDNAIDYKLRQDKSFSVYESKNIEIYCGDIFNLEASFFQEIDAVYDRASFVALNPELNKKYVELLTTKLLKETKYFLINLFYEEEEFSGPPFSHSEQEIRILFQNFSSIELLDSRDALSDAKHLIERGLTNLQEDAFLLTR